MITRRFTVEMHQEMHSNHPGQISDREILLLINQRLGSLISSHHPIDAISVYRDATSPGPEIGAIIEQSWIPWNDPPHPIATGEINEQKAGNRHAR